MCALLFELWRGDLLLGATSGAELGRWGVKLLVALAAYRFDRSSRGCNLLSRAQAATSWQVGKGAILHCGACGTHTTAKHAIQDAPAITGVPHAVQNLAEGVRSAAHFVHFDAAGLPHWVQNLAPAATVAPQAHLGPASTAGLPLHRARKMVRSTGCTVEEKENKEAASAKIWAPTHHWVQNFEPGTSCARHPEHCGPSGRGAHTACACQKTIIQAEKRDEMQHRAPIRGPHAYREEPASRTIRRTSSRSRPRGT